MAVDAYELSEFLANALIGIGASFMLILVMTSLIEPLSFSLLLGIFTSVILILAGIVVRVIWIDGKRHRL